ncbi:MAG: YDG domain-containing protein, partial [Bacteroidales bacterium]
DKVYDGLVDATITDKWLEGVLPVDTARIFLTGGLASFNDPNVGEDKPVNASGMILTGPATSDYRLDFVNPTTADIYPLDLQVVITVADKIYDGNTDATIIGITLAGLKPGDKISWSGGTASFITPEVGDDKTVNITGLTFHGIDLRNYLVSQNYTTTASIFPLQVGAFVYADKEVYKHSGERVTLTAVIEGGAPLAEGEPQAALTTAFVVDGMQMRDAMGNSEIPMIANPETGNLTAVLAFPVYQITSASTVAPGVKHVEAHFNGLSPNFLVVPNPATTEFRYEPLFEVFVYPNPSPGYANFRITVDAGSLVTLELFTVTGQFLSTLYHDFIPASGHTVVTFSATLDHLAHGVYVYRAFNGFTTITGKLVLVNIFK